MKKKSVNKTEERKARKARRPAPPLPPESYVVDPPEGIRLYVGNGFCTDVIPKGHALVVNYVTHAKSLQNRSTAYVHLTDTTTHRDFRLEWGKFAKMVEQGVVKL